MQIKKYISALKLNALFKGFSDEELTNCLVPDMYTISRYKKNSTIHFESEKCLALGVILSGTLLIQNIDECGNVLTITEFHTGNSIGENLIFSAHPHYPMNVIAKSDVTLLHLQKDLVLHLCQSHTAFLFSYLTSISNKAMLLTNKIKSVSMKSLREAIIAFLRAEYHCQSTYKIKLNTTKKDLAEKLGVQRTSLSRELNKMRKEQLITYDAYFINILDPNLLK